MEQIFIQLTLILLTAFVVSRIARAFNQPVIIGYIFAGVVIALFIGFDIVNLGESAGIIEVFSKLGIAFLLFVVGLHMNPKVIKEIGASSFLIGLGQVVFTFLLSFFISYKLLGYGLATSSYVGIAIAFSSTIIIMKLLSDDKRLDSLHSKISIGILIFQDLVAIVVLMVISSLSNGTDFSSFVLKGLLGGTLLVLFLFLLGYLYLPKMTAKIATSQELLFLFSICWCFSISSLFSFIGFSFETGALIAGIVLSVSPYSVEISSKVRPLRDFFLIIFFIILGLNIQFDNISEILIDSIILSAVILILKPLIVLILMRFAGYTKRTNFFVGTSLAQISEFSLIVLALGVSLNQVSKEILSTMTLAGIITIALSTYMITHSEKLYEKLSGVLTIFERKNIRKDQKRELNKKYNTILFGYNRIGFSILRYLKHVHKNYLVVDFNPDTISTLKKMGVPSLYGDASDCELLTDLPLDKLELAVSTLPDFETNVLLVEKIRMENPDAIIIASARQVKEALELYQKGASYVLIPHLLGGEYIAKMIGDYKTTKKDYDKEKEKHIKLLEDRLKKISED